jgi:aminomethyltransferase
MTFTRNSALASRHEALGAELGEWNDMGVAWEYNQDVNDEHKAVRTVAGLFDVSGLKKIHILGPDALAVADHLITRDMTKITAGRSVYAIILDENGGFTDDCIMFHLAPNHMLLVHGGGTARTQVEKSADGKNVVLQFDDDLHDLSFQGPKSLDILNPHTPMDLENLKYFHQQATTLFGHNCIISRTGFSGERGYEIFAKGEDATAIWDAILEHGRPQGVLPCTFNCIDAVRVEAALLFYPFDMDESNSPWEVGLGFAVSKDKPGDYRGKQACLDAIGKEKVKVTGIVADTDGPVDADARLFQGDRQVGKVTAPNYSPVLKQSLALVHIEPGLTEPGTKVEVRGENVTCSATVHSLPFYDPKKDNRSS